MDTAEWEEQETQGKGKRQDRKRYPKGKKRSNENEIRKIRQKNGMRDSRKKED